MVKIAVSGACGKMGKRIISLAGKDPGLELIFGLENINHQDINKTVNGIEISADLGRLETCDCLIDFSMPGAILEYLPYLLKFRKCAVIGTTGFDENEQLKIKQASQVIPVVFSPNMSVGVNLLFRLIKDAAKILKEYTVNIEESHHIHKKDSPSGTAKKIAQIVNEQGFNLKIEEIKAVREDEIVGEHRVLFESGLDKIELFHSAKTRDIFVQGALRAAKWVVNKNPRLYSMDDVLFNKP